jgi:hypothetical protein
VTPDGPRWFSAEQGEVLLHQSLRANTSTTAPVSSSASRCERLRCKSTDPDWQHVAALWKRAGRR